VSTGRTESTGTVSGAPESLSAADPLAGSTVRWNADGLVPAIVQDVDSGDVLMLAWMDRAALVDTMTSGYATFWSRSRGQRWVKGATSGNVQRVREVSLDCDGDAVLVRVDPAGPACHTGDRTCFDAHRMPVSTPAGATT